MANKRRQPVSYRQFKASPVLAEGLLGVARSGGELEEKVAQAFFRMGTAQGARNDRRAEAAGRLAGQMDALENRPSISVEGGAAASTRIAPGQPFKTNDPIAEDLPPEGRAFLNAIAGGESGGRYNVRYTPKGGALFDDLSRHPGIMEDGPHGKSSAAGRYQFTQTTWNRMGGGDFSPVNQDRRAWQLAQQDYQRNTGRDLLGDLQTGGLDGKILSALSPTWAAFNHNRPRHIATYQDSLLRFAGQGTAAPTGGPAPETVAPEVQAPKIVVKGGTFRPTGSDTIYGRAYDAAGTKTYLQALDVEMQQTQAQVYERFKDDPATMADAFEALKGEQIQNHVFDEIRADYEMAFDRGAGTYVMQAQKRLEQKREADNRTAYLERTTELEESQNRALAALDPENPATVAALQRTQAALDDHYDAAVSHGIIDQNAAGTAKRRSQGRTASGFYLHQAAGLDAEGVTVLRETMRKDYGAGKLTGIDGEAWSKLDGQLENLAEQKQRAETQAAKDLAERGAKLTQRVEQGFVADPDALAKLQLDANTAPDGPEIVDTTLKILDTAEVIRDRTLPEARAHVAEMRASLGKNPDASDLAAVTYGEGRIAELEEMVAKDAVGYEVATGRTRLEPIDTSSPDGLRESLTLRRNQMEGIARRYNRPLEVLRPGERAALARSLAENPEGFPDFVVALRDVFGERAPTVLAEISEDAPPLAHAAGVAVATGDMSVAQDVSAALSAKAQGIYKAKLPTASKFAAAAGPTFAGALSFLDRTRSATLSTAQLIFERDANMMGFDPAKIDDPDAPAGQAWQRALDRALGGATVGGERTGGLGQVNDFPIVVPPGMAAETPQRLIGGITEGDLSRLPPIRSANGVPVTARQLRQARLVTVGDGRYRVALGEPNGWDPQWVIGEDGDFWLLDLKALETGRPSRPTQRGAADFLGALER
ncbi:hypothetical protein [uncultured Nitratireductor sp.]|uniref:hypothetical protein n=1 Tax=uncultured Nitratireductor sp. TaxID=520953 RepID=UPI0025D2B631|nr:hypothetical protein [uncultured Nitratireductor sp.]